MRELQTAILLALALCFSVGSTSKNLPTFDEIKRDGISAIKFEEARIHSLNDVFVAVVVYETATATARRTSKKQ